MSCSYMNLHIIFTYGNTKYHFVWYPQVIRSEV
jgi:hypothetical protein